MIGARFRKGGIALEQRHQLMRVVFSQRLRAHADAAAICVEAGQEIRARLQSGGLDARERLG
jgi:hypothetical protein